MIQKSNTIRLMMHGRPFWRNTALLYGGEPSEVRIAVIREGAAINDTALDTFILFPANAIIRWTEHLPHEAWLSWGYVDIMSDVVEAMQEQVGYTFTKHLSNMGEVEHRYWGGNRSRIPKGNYCLVHYPKMYHITTEHVNGQSLGKCTPEGVISDPIDSFNDTLIHADSPEDAEGIVWALVEDEAYDSDIYLSEKWYHSAIITAKEISQETQQ